MKTIFQNQTSRQILFTLFILLLFSTATYAQSGGGYDLTWSTIDGGGGTSTGGIYSLTGTIGQPDAGVMAGDIYTVNGGFWASDYACIVDLLDMANFTGEWLNSGGVADFNSDNIVNLGDYRILAGAWLKVCPINWPWR